MANRKHVKLVRSGATAIVKWRKRDPLMKLDLSGVDLSGRDLEGADLSGADLKGAALRGTRLRHADLNQADLTGADLSHANLAQASVGSARLRHATLHDAVLNDASLMNTSACNADFQSANLAGADLFLTNLCGANLKNANLAIARLHSTHLKGADLSGARLTGASLHRLDLSTVCLDGAVLDKTLFVDVDLSAIQHPERLIHESSSLVPIDSLLMLRKQLPVDFLRALGIPAAVIANLDRLTVRPIEFLRSVIFHVPSDASFAVQLCEALRHAGLRCWLCQDYPSSQFDKVLIALSSNTRRSSIFLRHIPGWAQLQLGRTTIIPIQLDDTIHQLDHPLRDLLTRNIVDFRQWEQAEGFANALADLIAIISAADTSAGLGQNSLS